MLHGEYATRLRPLPAGSRLQARTYFTPKCSATAYRKIKALSLSLLLGLGRLGGHAPFGLATWLIMLQAYVSVQVEISRIFKISSMKPF